MNLVVLALELGYAPLEAGTTLLVVLRLTPDLGLMTVASVGLALTWFVLQLHRIRMAQPAGRPALCERGIQP